MSGLLPGAGVVTGCVTCKHDAVAAPGSPTHNEYLNRILAGAGSIEVGGSVVPNRHDNSGKQR